MSFNNEFSQNKLEELIIDIVDNKIPTKILIQLIVLMEVVFVLDVIFMVLHKNVAIQILPSSLMMNLYK